MKSNDDDDDEEYNKNVNAIKDLLSGERSRKESKSNTNNRNEGEEEERKEKGKNGKLTRKEEEKILKYHGDKWYKAHEKMFEDFAKSDENYDVKKLEISGGNIIPKRNKTLVFKAIGADALRLFDEETGRLIFDNYFGLQGSGFAVVYLGGNEIGFFGGGLGRCRVWNVRSESAYRIATMEVPHRYDPCAVLLRSGQVLIVGGGLRGDTQNNNRLKSCELYIREQDTFVLTVNEMNEGRSVATATELPDGNVIIIGGYGDDNVLKSTEIYNPMFGTFTKGPEMNFNRLGHSSTMLRNGKIIICGGASYEGHQNRVEFYDPITKIFTVGPSMLQYRRRHSATLLEDGRVLLCGGDTSHLDEDATEIYDPETNSFSIGPAFPYMKNN
jgi:hypothetical protein